MHKVCPLDNCSSVRCRVQIVEIEVAVLAYVYVFAKRIRLQQAIIDLYLLSRIHPLGLHEYAALLETVESTIGHQCATVILYQPGFLLAFACQRLARGSSLTVSAQRGQQSPRQPVLSLYGLEIVFPATGMQE